MGKTQDKRKPNGKEKDTVAVVGSSEEETNVEDNSDTRAPGAGTCHFGKITKRKLQSEKMKAVRERIAAFYKGDKWDVILAEAKLPHVQ